LIYRAVTENSKTFEQQISNKNEKNAHFAGVSVSKYNSFQNIRKIYLHTSFVVISPTISPG
jgi:hypothetical protein